MERIATWIFAFFLIFLFILQGQADDHLRIILALFLSGVISVFAFLVHWISLDAILAGTIFGGFVFGLGGWVAGGLVLVFFVSSSLLTGNQKDRFPQAGERRRNEMQIWANGFWILFCVVLWFLFRSAEWMLMTASVIATVTADTWATALGSRKGGATVLITTFEPVPAGRDGGVSLQGTFGSLCGAVLIAICYLLFTGDFSLKSFVIISLSGLAGCLVDSLLGALLQSDEKAVAESDFRNSLTNWYSSGTGALFAWILSQIY